MLRVPVRLLDPDLALPSYARVGDAGADLVAREGAVLAPGGWFVASTSPATFSSVPPGDGKIS